MTELTTHERMTRMFQHRDADRIPVIDHPWAATRQRWHDEGLDPDGDYYAQLGIDRIVGFGVDNTPRYPVETVAETDDYRITTTAWGVTLKNFKRFGSTPEFLDFKIKTPDDWRAAKKRMTPEPDRILWDDFSRHFPRWRQEGAWIDAGLHFGFDMTHSWIVGTERVLMAIIENPDWLVEMFHHCLDVELALLEMLLAADYTFHGIRWCDDMGYKHNQFFSLATYRELLKPVHARAIAWAHDRGLKAHLHSCGDINPFVPELVSLGLDALNPLEVKAGMDPIALKKTFGDKLVFQGGVNAVHYDDLDRLCAEMEQIIPVMKQNGGYIFSSDHSVPQTVALRDFRRIIALAKDLGRYA